MPRLAALFLFMVVLISAVAARADATGTFGHRERGVS